MVIKIVLIITLIIFIILFLFFVVDNHNKKFKTFLFYPSYVYGLFMSNHLRDLDDVYFTTFENPKIFKLGKCYFIKDINNHHTYDAYILGYNNRRYNFDEIYKIKLSSFSFFQYVKMLQQNTMSHNKL